MRLLPSLVLLASAASHAAADQLDDAFLASLRPCPAACAGPPQNWTVYPSVDRLNICSEPVLLDFAIRNPLDDPGTSVKLRTCTAGDSSDLTDAMLSRTASKRASDSCLAGDETQITLGLSVAGDSGQASGGHLHSAVQQVETYLSDSTNCDSTFIVGYNRRAAVAVYSGASVDNAATAPSVLSALLDQISSDGQAPKSLLLQLCGAGRNANHTFGVAIDTTGGLAAVQKAAKSWSNGECVADVTNTTQLSGVSIFEAPFVAASNVTSSNSTASSNGTAVSDLGGTVAKGPSRRSPLAARDDCRTVTVVSGDSCGALASECGITGAQFTQFNPDPNLCSTLAVGQRVCCTSGTLPDLTPKPNPDGSCAVYEVQSGDFCAQIAASNSLQVSDLSTFNDKVTWGWSGCSNLLVGLKLCLSTGSPPLPAPVTNALCGPQVPGTQPLNASDIAAGRTIADLNPCPLNSCCDIWGQCGITEEYCDDTRGATGNPGTAPPGTNGCISNCGTDVVNNENGPSSFMSVGYYESWNFGRPCLNLRASSLDLSDYTHIHWGFATITDSLDVGVDDPDSQLEGFKGLSMKKILSFGGWGFSTDPSTYEQLRLAVDPANADAVASNIVNYINSNGLDGVDIDWEYPGAPDIPGIPPGLASDGPNYLNFLKVLRGKLDSSKSLSIALPASYWYLRSFPVAQMAQYVDYFVYMTYDLHGQWDYGNAFSQEGCSGGNCLRSHVNLTETMYALAMLTKAGVPSNKINVGVSSYGRSFGMVEAGCWLPDCQFGGPDSTAWPGQCTDTSGYIANAEITDLIDSDLYLINQMFDSDSHTDLLVYNETQWVSYLSDTVKMSRTSQYKGLNFAGTVDWAVDLQEFTDDDGTPDESEELPPTDPLPECTATFSSVEELDANIEDVAQHCGTIYVLNTLNDLLKTTLSNYTDMINSGYDGKFNTFSKAVADSAGNQVHDFVYQNGNKYFSCLVAEMSVCCDYCAGGVNPASQCNYCFDDEPCEITCIIGVDCPKRKRETGPNNGGGGSETTTRNFHMGNHSEPCPPDYSQRGYGPDNPYEQSVYWSFSDEDGFYGDLLLSTGILKDKTAIRNVDRGNDCAPSAEPTDSCWGIGIDYDIPVVNGFSQSDVANPKDIVKAGLDKAQQLGPQIDTLVQLLQLDGYWGDEYEVLDAVALPILMLAEATEQMAVVETTADEIDAAKRKAFILAFISAILFIVPVVGEVVGSVAELADVGAILSLLGTAGNVAEDIYTILDDPENAPLAIFDLVLSPLALADTGLITRAANFRRGMSASDVAKLGERVESRMNTVKKVTGTCTKRS